MPVNIEDVKKLREMTGAGMMDCKKALEDADGAVERAVTILRERGLAKAARKVGRATANGVVEAYLHRVGDYPPQIGVLVELNCETDFVAKSEDFRELAREIALHVAAARPSYLSREDVPESVVAAEMEIYRNRAEADGKPAAAIEKIVAGQLEGFYKENCLLDQAYVREPKRQIKDLITEAIARLQENITVRRFARFDVRES